MTTINDILPRLTSPKILVFELSLECRLQGSWKNVSWTYCGTLVESWLGHICSRSPEEIIVKLSRYLESEPTPVVMVPSCVLQCESLTSLILGEGFDFDYSFEDNYISLPRLKKLEITMYDAHRMLMATLFKSKSCPMLEDLRIRTNIDENDHLVDISSHSLRYLSVFSIGNSTRSKVLIDAPNLEEIVISCNTTGLVCYQVVKKFSGLLHKADIDLDVVHPLEPNNANLVKELSGHVRTLKLRGCTINFLVLAGAADYKMSIFSNLIELDISGLKAFSMLLRFCPNLESIVWARSYEDRIRIIGHELRDSAVPSCLSKKVKRIKIEKLGGTEDELDVLKYILTHAEVLEHLTIYVDHMSKEDLAMEVLFCHQLLCFQRRLECCKIEFYGRYMTASTNGLKNGILDCQIKCSSELSGIEFSRVALSFSTFGRKER